MPPKSQQNDRLTREEQKKLREQFERDLHRQLKKQTNNEVLTSDGLVTLTSAHFIFSNVICELSHAEMLELDKNLLVQTPDELIKIDKTGIQFDNIARFYRDQVEPAWQDFINKNPGHSDDWYADRMESTSTIGYSSMSLTNMISSLPTQISDETKQDFEETFQLDSTLTIDNCFAALLKKKRAELRSEQDYNTQKDRAMLQSMRDNDSREIYEFKINKKNGQWNSEKEWIHVNEDDPGYKKYLEDQKKLKKTEAELTKREGDVASFTFFKKVDFSYLTDEALKKSIADKLGNGFYHFQKNKGHISKKEYEDNKKLFHDLDQLQSSIRSAKPWFHWLRKTRRYDAVKQSVKELRKVLQNGDTAKNRDALRLAYQNVENACNIYQGKHPQKNKALIAQLKNFQQENMERFENRARMIVEQKPAIEAAQAALEAEKNCSLHPEDHAPYRRNLTLYNMIAEDYYEKNVRISKNFNTEPFPLADVIAHPEKYADEKKLALKSWDTAVKNCEPNMLSCSKLKSRLGHFQHGLEMIDLEKQALDYLGIEEPDKTKRAELLSTPENKEKLQPFYDAVSGLIELCENDTFKAVLYDIKQTPGDQDAAKYQETINKFKKDFLNLTQPERIKVGYKKINEDNIIHNQIERVSEPHIEKGTEAKLQTRTSKVK